MRRCGGYALRMDGPAWLKEASCSLPSQSARALSPAPSRGSCRRLSRMTARYRLRSSLVIWIRLPLVSSRMAMVEPVTFIGGMVNATPAALRRSYSD